jgi:hypothetical protein
MLGQGFGATILSLVAQNDSYPAGAERVDDTPSLLDCPNVDAGR